MGHADQQVLRRMGILAIPDCQMLDVVGPLEVFSHADRDQQHSGRPKLRYELLVIGLDFQPVVTSQGTSLAVHCSFDQAPALDTLLIAGGRGPESHQPDVKLRDWLHNQRRDCRRFGSVCTGAIVLARSGLLDGTRATTHWAYCDTLRKLSGSTEILADAIFTEDGNLYTSAGVTAGIDLALHFVDQDLGSEVALKIARDLVVYMKRTGGQSQYSSKLAIQIGSSSRFGPLQDWLLANLDQSISVAQMASRVHLSARAFSRHFREELGIPPAHYLEQLRIDAARELLSDSDCSVLEIAIAAGFGSSERMRRAFRRNLGVSATQYRAQFSSANQHSNR